MQSASSDETRTNRLVFCPQILPPVFASCFCGRPSPATRRPNAARLSTRPYNREIQKTSTFGRLLKRKSPSHRHASASISPLLAAVAKRTSISPSFRDRILLGCYIALDALNRGQASQDLYVLLGQFLLMGEALTAMGYSSEAKPHFLAARSSLYQVHERAAGGVWALLEPEYLVVSESIAWFAAQLDSVSYEHLLEAEVEMRAYLAAPVKVT